MPFHVTTTWTDGRSSVDLTAVQQNVPVDAVRFAKPAPPVAPPAPAQTRQKGGERALS
jgi:hypothetical protein